MKLKNILLYSVASLLLAGCSKSNTSKMDIISFFILSIFLLIGCSSDNNSSAVDETFTVSGKVVD